jgi:hypothetical protein
VTVHDTTNGLAEDITVTIEDLRLDDEGRVSLSTLSLFQSLALERSNSAIGTMGCPGGA